MLFRSAYKLTAYAGAPRLKLSEGKASLPGAKQVYRTLDAQGIPESDLLTLKSEHASGIPLLHQIMRAGKRVGGPEQLHVGRERCIRMLEKLPVPLRSLINAGTFPVGLSAELSALCEKTRRIA